MGAKMTKELGLYNEEEVCTPVCPQKYRQLFNDPRSVTIGINRTPIQVECTPTGVKTVINREILSEVECTPTGVKTAINRESVSEVECTPTGVKTAINRESVSEAGSSYTEDTDIKSELENDSGFKDEKVEESIVKEESIVIKEDKAAEPQTKYLETDIDKLDSPLPNTSTTKSLMDTDDKPKHQLFDVRSPSLEIARTPVLVECTPELFALHSRIDSLSFCDFDVQMEDPSVIVSDDEQASLHNQSTINNWLVNVNDRPSNDTPINNSFTESPKQVAKKQKELNALKKQLFFTPDVKEITKPKARTPLGDLQTSQFQNSPLKVVRSKQWRNIQDERQRLGLDTENTPPNMSLPPLSKISSAPGKMIDRKRSKINWDEENVMMI